MPRTPARAARGLCDAAGPGNVQVLRETMGAMSAPADRSATPSSSSAAGTLFREHVLPGPTAWIVSVAIGAALGLVLVPLSTVAAIAISAVSIIAAIVVVIVWSPVLVVADGQFRMGRARIEVELLGEPEVLEGEDWQHTIGQGFEPLAYHCVRGWTRTGLRAEVLDEEDPTTAWIASTRRPQDLALALRAAQQKARPASA